MNNIIYQGIEGIVTFNKNECLYKAAINLKNIDVNIGAKNSGDLLNLFKTSIDKYLLDLIKNKKLQKSTDFEIFQASFSDSKKCKLIKDYWSYSFIERKFTFTNKQLRDKYDIREGELQKVIKSSPFIINNLTCLNNNCNAKNNTFQLKIHNKSSFNSYVNLYTESFILINPCPVSYFHAEYDYIQILPELLCESCNTINRDIKSDIKNKKDIQLKERERKYEEERNLRNLNNKKKEDFKEYISSILNQSNDSLNDINEEILNSQNEIIAFKSKIKYLERKKEETRLNFLIENTLPNLKQELKNVLYHISNSKNKHQVYKSVFKGDYYDIPTWNIVNALEVIGLIEVVRKDGSDNVLSFEVPQEIKSIFSNYDYDFEDDSTINHLSFNEELDYKEQELPLLPHENFDEETGTFIMSNNMSDDDFEDFSNEKSPL